MKLAALLIMLSATSFLSAQQTEGLKTEKTAKASILERRIPEKSNDSVAKKNLNNILKQTNTSNSVFGTADLRNSEIGTNVERLQNQVNSFNGNNLYRMQTNGQGIQLNKRK